MEDDRAGRHVAFLDPVDQRLDVLGGEVAQQLALGEQGDARARLLALAVEGVLEEARGIADRRTLLLEEERGQVVDGGARREAAVYYQIGRAHV